MRCKFLVIVFVFLGVDVVGQDKPVAKVGRYNVMASEFKHKYRPTEGMDVDSLKETVLGELIGEKLMLIDAYEKGYDEGIEEQLVGQRNRLTVGKLYEQMVVKRAKVSPWEVRQHWWRLGTRLKLSQIIVKDKGKLRDIYNELRGGAEFSDLARKYSDGPQARYGGDIGEVRWGQLEPELERVVFRMDSGQVSRPIEVRGEYRIIKVNDVISVRKPDFATEKDKIEDRLKGEKQARLANEYIEHLRRVAHPRYNLKVIERVVKSPENVGKEEIMMSWTGGEFTVGEFLEKADREIKMGRLLSADAVKTWLLNRLTYEILLPLEARRHRFHRLPDVKDELRTREEGILLREYRRVEIDEKVSLTDDEIKEYYEANRDKYETGEKVSLTDKEVKEYYERHRDKYEGKFGRVKSKVQSDLEKEKEFERAKSRVKWDLDRERKKEREEEIIRELREKVKVEVFEDNLREL